MRTEGNLSQMTPPKTPGSSDKPEFHARLSRLLIDSLGERLPELLAKVRQGAPTSSDIQEFTRVTIQVLIDDDRRHEDRIGPCRHHNLIHELQDKLAGPDQGESSLALFQLADHFRKCGSRFSENSVFEDWLTELINSGITRQLRGVMDTIVEVASYLGAGALGGIVGNRADAALVTTVRAAFQSVRTRWLARTSTDDAPLAEDEASDAAKAAAIARKYEPATLTVTSAHQQPDGSWIVHLDTSDPHNQQRQSLRAHVPPGDPAHATILIIPET
jgi:hypothetical protein